MTEPLLPCPVCGNPGKLNMQQDRAYCDQQHSLTPDAWQRLADAVELQQAVEVLERAYCAHRAAIGQPTQGASALLDERWIGYQLNWIDTALIGPLAPALIALAERIKVIK